MKYHYELISSACPEQYDVFSENKQIAYIRLRYGYLSVDVPDCGGETIYDHTFEDGWKGQFDSQEERIKFLTIIDLELQKYYKEVIDNEN